MENDFENLKHKLESYRKEPPASVWEAIEREHLPKANVRVHSFRSIYYAAASVLIILGISLYFVHRFYNSGQQEKTIAIIPSPEKENTIVKGDEIVSEVINVPKAQTQAGEKEDSKKNEQIKTENLLITVSTTNEKKVIILSDSSIVTLNAFSEIAYRTTFTDKREVSLSGEAFFEVSKDAYRPFIIHANNSRTEVLGTSFLLKSKEDQPADEIYVVSGKVVFGPSKNFKKKSILLTKGLKASSENPKALPIEDPNFASWKSMSVQFNNTPLTQVCKSLEAHFKVPVIIKSPQIRYCRFTGTFKNPSLEGILELMKVSSDIRFQKVNDKYVLSGRGCN